MKTETVPEPTTRGPAQDQSTARRPDAALSELEPVNGLKLRLSQLVLEFIDRKPGGVSEQLFTKVTDILFEKVSDPAYSARELKPDDALTMLRQAKGALSSLKDEFDRSTPEADRQFRKDTMAWLDGLMNGLKPEPLARRQVAAQGASREDYVLSEKIKVAAMLTTEGYLDFLKEQLHPQTGAAWNAFNLVGAIEKLANSHTKWGHDPGAMKIASLLCDRLLSVSEQEGLSISEKSFQVLCGSIHTVSAVLDRQRVKDPEKEEALFKAAAALSSCTTPGNPPGTIDHRFFWPLDKINPAFLSPRGNAALCAYIDEVHQVAGHIQGAEKLDTIASAFRSLKEISCWADTPENQLHLKSILTNLNKRLESNKEAMESEELSSILSGLNGIEGGKLDQDIQKELARTILLVSKRVSEMQEVPSLKAICLGILGVSPSLGVATDPLKAAVSNLMSGFHRRLPEPPTTMSDLGYACRALNALVPHVERFGALAGAMWREVVQPIRYNRFQCDRTARSDLVAWAVVQQAHFQYGVQIPDGLEQRLRALAPNAERLAHASGSKSQDRVRGVLQEIPGIEVGSTVHWWGFEGDIAIRFEGNPRSYVVEVDGPFHQAPTGQAKNKAKTEAFEELGVTVIRVASGASEEDVKAAVEQHRRATPGRR